jgi:hypothetical protein
LILNIQNSALVVESRHSDLIKENHGGTKNTERHGVCLKIGTR